VRSSNGTYYPGLDHLRALAAFLVFGWHFTHGFNGFPAPFGPGATPVLAPFNEGHCGVALFMCLSGYLFAKLLDGKEVIWRNFYWNRFVRLGPLLIILFTLRGLMIAYEQPDLLGNYAAFLIVGFIKPIWEHGAWSVAVEIHFYLLLWLIIPLTRRWAPSLFCTVAVALIIRTVIHASGGDVEYYAYFTIFGRIDQFVLGIAAWTFRDVLTGRHVWMALSTAAFFAFYQAFADIGGYYAARGTPLVWIVIPTIEAAYFSFLVVYYDTTFVFGHGRLWRFLQAAGAASYSIYLLHTFFVFDLAKWLNDRIPGMSTWEMSELVVLPIFAAFVPVAWLCYRLVEMPFLRFRTRYTAPGLQSLPRDSTENVPARAIRAVAE